VFPVVNGGGSNRLGRACSLAAASESNRMIKKNINAFSCKVRTQKVVAGLNQLRRCGEKNRYLKSRSNKWKMSAWKGNGK